MGGHTKTVSVHDIHTATMNDAKCAEEDCTITWNTYIKTVTACDLIFIKGKVGGVHAEKNGFKCLHQ